MGHRLRLESVSIPSLEGGQVDRHPSFFIYLSYISLFHAHIRNQLQNTWYPSIFSNVSFVVICFGW